MRKYQHVPKSARRIESVEHQALARYHGLSKRGLDPLSDTLRGTTPSEHTKSPPTKRAGVARCKREAIIPPVSPTTALAGHSHNC